MIKDVLNFETIGDINPINEYIRHTLKAFIRHVSTQSKSTSKSPMRVGEDLGEIIEKTKITLKNGKSYEVVRRDSTQIQVFDAVTGEKEIAKPILYEFINENSLTILEKEREFNTRQVGARFFQWHRENKK